VPGKAAYVRLENDADLEFEFMLAEKLGRTVAELRATLDNAEFVLWSRFYARRNQQAELARLMAG
jgi:allophanate hydrolase subunit 2